VNKPKDNSKLAIVGIGCVFPKADNLEEYWSNIRRGVDAITDVPTDTHWNPADYFDADKAAPDMTYAARGGFINPVPFDALAYGISPNNIEATDTTQLLGMYVAQQALRDAGYETLPGKGDGKTFDRDRTCAILGVTGTLELVIPLGARLGHPLWRRALDEAGVPQDVANDVVARIADGYVPWQENSFPGLLGNVAAGRIANYFDLGGSNCVVDAACASSLSAIHMAAMELQTGKADMAITGGLDTFNDIFMYMCFSKTPALSPTGHSRPFSADGDGTILGEGLGVVVLKRLSDAQRDGDRVYAVIRGMGSSSDGKGNAIYAPSAAGQSKALRNAYHNADVTPDSIELIEAHGTGTIVGDRTELTALSDVYGEHRRDDERWCAVGSVKSMVGHTKAAAGVAGLIKTAMALNRKVLPPTIKVEHPLDIADPTRADAPLYVNTEARPWVGRNGSPRRAAISAFGFGGSNFHCVLEEADAAKDTFDWDSRVQLFALSGDSVDTLKQQLAGVDAAWTWPQLRYHAATSRQRFEAAASLRLVLVIERDTTDVAALRDGAKHMLESKPDADDWQTPDGAMFTRGECPGPVGVLFPGQGSQYVGMLRDLACAAPQIRRALEQADAAFGESRRGRRLSDHVYPVPVFDDDARARNEAALRATRVAQPAIGAASIGAWRLLRSFGLDATHFVGHSFGELTALAAAGRFDDDALCRLAAARGRLTAEAGDHADAGAMLAVAMPLEPLERRLAEHGLQLTVANRNAPQQNVLAGPTELIDRAETLLSADNVRVRRLEVAAAFHTDLVAAATRPFRDAVDAVPFKPTDATVYANTTAAPYPDDDAAARDLLANQLARPVQFAEQIRRMHDDGVRTFVEVGPSRQLAGLVAATLEGQPHHVISLDASRGKRSGLLELAQLLGRLAVLGYRLDLSQIDPNGVAAWDADEESKRRLTIPLSGANYVKPREKRPPRPKTETTPSKQSTHKSPPRMNDSKPQAPPPPSTPAPPPPAATQSALQLTQQNILALQQMQQQTARLHEQYLNSQAVAQQTLQQLIEQQQRMLAGAPLAVLPPTPTTPPGPAAAPAGPTQAPSPPPPAAAVSPPAAMPQTPPAPAPAPPQQPQQPAPPPQAAPAAAPAAQPLLLEVVAEKTGYPVDMLDLDMSLDADLGIDSIKRVEILSAMQERMPDAPAVRPEDLGALQTLRQIIDFLGAQEGVNEAAPSQQPAALEPDASPAAGDLGQVTQVMLDVVAEKTGYPVEMLDLDMSLDADLGIDSIKRVEILSAVQERMPDAPLVKPEDLGSMQTLRQIVDFLGKVEGTASTSARQASPAVEQTDDESLHRLVVDVVPINETDRPRLMLPDGHVVWITDDGRGLATLLADRLAQRSIACRVVEPSESPGDEKISGLVLLPSADATGTDVRRLFALLQRVGPAVHTAAEHGDVLLAGVTRLDGALGFGSGDVAQPQTAALAGIVKTAAREWPDVTCRIVDIADDDVAHIADRLADELTRRRPIEVGIRRGALLQPVLREHELSASGLPNLQAGDVVIVTGGARGVTAEVAVALANASPCKLVLLGRSAPPADEPAHLRGVSDEPAIKAAIATHADSKLSPREIDAEYRRVIASHEIRNTLQRLKAIGCETLYLSVDVRDAQAVREAVADCRDRLGPIRGIVHGAGVLADRLIADKTPEQFDLVYGTKVEGFRHLLDATDVDDLKLIATFASSTARFGRKGQVDYAAANEVLNKMAQREARRREDCRVVSINWGPWDGGMVTAALRDLFASEGVGVIPLTAGAGHLVAELAAGDDAPVEVTVLGPGTKLALLPGYTAETTAPSPPAATRMHIAFERQLTLEDDPFLKDHVLNHLAVLPVAMMFEWMAHAALHEHPGMVLVGIENLRVYKGVKVDAERGVMLRVHASAATPHDQLEHVTVELRSDDDLNASATVTLADMACVPAPPTFQPAKPTSGSRSSVYDDDALFHGPTFHAITELRGMDASRIVAAASCAAPPATWMSQPLRARWLADPLAIDAAFQMMILWSEAHQNAPSLPTAIRSYEQFVRQWPSDGVDVHVTFTEQREHSAVADVTFTDNAGKIVAVMRDVETIVDASLVDAFARNNIPQQVQA